jgi:cytoskeleton protein RodZ
MTARDDPEGPGAQLREARHRANFSLEDVSAELHLNPETVRALEENCFEDLPAPAFVRGYIRSYARLLNLPPGPILEAYDRKGFTAPTIVPDIARQPQAKSTDVPVRLATYLVAAGLVVMVVMWWQSREAPTAPLDKIAQAAGPPVPAPPESPASAAPAVDFPATNAPASQAAQASGDLEFPAEVEPVTDDPGPLAALPEAAARPVDPGPPLPASSRESGAAAPSAVAFLAPAGDVAALPEIEAGNSTDTAADAAPPPLSAGSDVPRIHLALAFDQESWVEVYDGKGDRLVYRLAGEGQRVTLDAEPPVRVLLGYAPAARISFNGRALDFSPFMERGMARFVVTADGATEAPPAAADGNTDQNTDRPATAAAVPDL